MPRPRRREYPAPVTQPARAAAPVAVRPAPLTEPLRSATSTPRPLPRPTPRVEPNQIPSYIAAAPAAPAYEEDEELYDEDEEYVPQQESFLRNPYVLAALAVAGAIVMAVVVVVLAGAGGGGGNNNTGGLGPLPTSDALTQIPGGMLVDSISTSTVREGPGIEYEALGTLPRGQKVQVVGRDEDGGWLQIVFPQNSTSRGWVPATALKVSDLNIPALPEAVNTPIVRPTQTILPTATLEPEPEPTEVVEEEEEPTPTPTVTGTVGPAPDLGISFVGSCSIGSPVSVVIRNVGSVPVVNRSVVLTVSVGGVPSSTQITTIADLQPGATLAIPTSEVVEAPSTAITAELQGAPGDSDASDNTVECTPGGGEPTPSSTMTTPEPTSTPPATP